MADQLKLYLDSLGKVLRDKRQRASFAKYALGLLTDGERKSHGADRSTRLRLA